MYAASITNNSSIEALIQMSMLSFSSVQAAVKPMSPRMPCRTVSSVILLVTSWVTPLASVISTGSSSSQDSMKNSVMPLTTWSLSSKKPA